MTEDRVNYLVDAGPEASAGGVGLVLPDRKRSGALARVQLRLVGRLDAAGHEISPQRHYLARVESLPAGSRLDPIFRRLSARPEPAPRRRWWPGRDRSIPAPVDTPPGAIVVTTANGRSPASLLAEADLDARPVAIAPGRQNDHGDELGGRALLQRLADLHRLSRLSAREDAALAELLDTLDDEDDPGGRSVWADVRRDPRLVAIGLAVRAADIPDEDDNLADLFTQLVNYRGL